MTPIVRLVCLLAALSAGTQACTSQATRLAAHDREVAQLRERLMRQGDTDSLAAAALLVGGQQVDAPQRLAWLQRAVAQSPERADLRLRLVQVCLGVQGCDAPAAVEALIAADPGNGAAYLQRLALADDDAAVQASLEGIGNARRFEVYGTVTLAHLMRTLMKSGGYHPLAAQIYALASGTGSDPYALVKLTEACRGPAIAVPARLEACRRVARVMGQSDGHITAIVGHSIARHAWPEGSAEHTQAGQALRVERYQSLTEGEVSERHLSDAWAREYLRLCETEASEQAVTRGMLALAHRDPQPPADYRSPYG